MQRVVIDNCNWCKVSWCHDMPQTLTWIDTHCHLDASEFDTDRDDVRHQALQAGVTRCLYPAVEAANFDTVRLLAHRHNAPRDVYALGLSLIHI